MRKILLNGVDNARDFGGTVAWDGRVVKPGVLIRSNHLEALSDDDVRCLVEEYHLRRVIDIRTDKEVREKPDREIPGVVWLHLPLIKELEVGITHEESADFMAVLGAIPDMAWLYGKIVTDEFSVDQIGRVLAEIMAEKDGAVLWHCTEGKDRCGIITALILELLGVEREMIFLDYLATNQASVKRARIYYDMLVEKTGDKKLAENVRKMFMADSTYLQAAYDAIEESYGSVCQFFEQRLGIKEEQRAQFRSRCLI